MSVGFIGTGSMGAMLVRAMVRSGRLAAKDVYAANRSPEKLLRLEGEVPGIVSGSNAEVLARCATVFVCLKPAEALVTLLEHKSALSNDHLIVILANLISLETLEKEFPCRFAKVIPSIAAESNAAATLVMPGSRASEADRRMLVNLVSGMGSVHVIAEAFGRSCTDLTSCGPAFIADILQQMAAAACRANPRLDPAFAWDLVADMAAGTLKLLRESGLALEEIRARVAVPGGTTAEGLEVLDARMPTVWDEVLARTRESEAVRRKKLGVAVG